jgi:hypothetical protein
VADIVHTPHEPARAEQKVHGLLSAQSWFIGLSLISLH